MSLLPYLYSHIAKSDNAYDSKYGRGGQMGVCGIYSAVVNIIYVDFSNSETLGIICDSYSSISELVPTESELKQQRQPRYTHLKLYPRFSNVFKINIH